MFQSRVLVLLAALLRSPFRLRRWPRYRAERRPINDCLDDSAEAIGGGCLTASPPAPPSSRHPSWPPHHRLELFLELGAVSLPAGEVLALTRAPLRHILERTNLQEARDGTNDNQDLTILGGDHWLFGRCRSRPRCLCI